MADVTDDEDVTAAAAEEEKDAVGIGATSGEVEARDGEETLLLGGDEEALLFGWVVGSLCRWGGNRS